MASLYNDLNTSSALAIMWEMIGDKADRTYSTILAMNRILNLDLSYEDESENKIELDDETQEKVNQLLERRKWARVEKDWETSDDIRSQLQDLGIEVVD